MIPRSTERFRVYVPGRPVDFRTERAARGFASQMRAAGKTVRIKKQAA